VSAGRRCGTSLLPQGRHADLEGGLGMRLLFQAGHQATYGQAEPIYSQPDNRAYKRIKGWAEGRHSHTHGRPTGHEVYTCTLFYSHGHEAIDSQGGRKSYEATYSQPGRHRLYKDGLQFCHMHLCLFCLSIRHSPSRMRVLSPHPVLCV
jgi:hypothetical protein